MENGNTLSARLVRELKLTTKNSCMDLPKGVVRGRGNIYEAIKVTVSMARAKKNVESRTKKNGFRGLVGHGKKTNKIHYGVLNKNAASESSSALSSETLLDETLLIFSPAKQNHSAGSRSAKPCCPCL